MFYICVIFIITALTADCCTSQLSCLSQCCFLGSLRNTQIYLVGINIKWAAVSKKKILELAYSTNEGLCLSVWGWHRICVCCVERHHRLLLREGKRQRHISFDLWPQLEVFLTAMASTGNLGPRTHSNTLQPWSRQQPCSIFK